MTERITHSIEGLVRAIEMSSDPLHVFCEGKSDIYIYEQIINRVRTTHDITVQLHTSDTLPVSKPGKDGLVELFRHFSCIDALTFRRFDKPKRVVFVLDKDVDDVTDSTIQSPHVCYTEHYDIEGHVFSAGDVQRAIVIAGQVASSEAFAAIPNVDDWLGNIFEKWKHWLTLCLITQRTRLNTGYSYSRTPTHSLEGEFEADAPRRYAQIVSEIPSKTKCDLTTFAEHQQWAESVIRSISIERRYLSVIKGKWLPHLLEMHLLAQAIPGFAHNAFAARFYSALTATISFDLPWVDFLLVPLTRHAGDLSSEDDAG